MLNTPAVVVRFNWSVNAVSSKTTALPAWNVTLAPRYCQLVVTPMSHGVPFVPVHVRAATLTTSNPTTLFAVSFVRTAVTPAGSDASEKALKPAPPSVLYLISGTSPNAGTPVKMLTVTVPDVVKLVAVMTALAVFRLPS